MQHDILLQKTCPTPECYSSVLAQKEWLAIWPLKLVPERGRRGTYIWYMYVEWRSNEGTHITRYFCGQHHQVMLDLFQTSALVDRREQEATDRWLVQVNSKLTRS